MQNDWKLSWQIAFTFIGTVVGAGFASGKELLVFFVQYGVQGLIGILLATLLFTWAGTQVMLVSHRIQARSYQDISAYLFGKTLGLLFHVLLLIVLLGTTSVMLAASGAVFIETFQFPSQAGIWLTMICIYLVAHRGLHAIHSVNSVFVPLLIAFTCYIFIHHVKPWEPLLDDGVLVESVRPLVWISSPLYYVSLNVALAQAVLVPIGKESKREGPLIYGGVLGGLGIGLLLLLGYLSIRTHMPEIQQADMPMIYLLSGSGRGMSILFTLLVYAEIFSTLIANVYGLAQQLQRFLVLSTSLLILFILVVCYFVSFIGFSSLLSFLYPLFGQIVIIFLLMLLYRQWKNASWPPPLRHLKFRKK